MARFIEDHATDSAHYEERPVAQDVYKRQAQPLQGQTNRQMNVPRWNRGRMQKLLNTSFLFSGMWVCL